jgi:dTDP-4-dehydrorhamnose reductase
MRIVVTGGAGYLGSEVARQAVAAGHDVLATQLEHAPPHGRALRLDLRDDDAVQRAVMKHGPDVVVHTAYRQADDALAGDVVRASRNIALASHRLGARLLNLSTDLVFDGEQGAPYREKDEPRPVSDYGQAKLEAERLVAELHPQALTVRTSLLYGKKVPGPQERLAAQDDAVFYVDGIRCPTIVGDLAVALLELAEADLAGVLHVAGPTAVSRLEFARLLGAADARGLPAPPGRARNVALDSSRAAALLSAPVSGIA